MRVRVRKSLHVCGVDIGEIGEKEDNPTGHIYMHYFCFWLQQEKRGVGMKSFEPFFFRSLFVDFW